MVESEWDAIWKYLEKHSLEECLLAKSSATEMSRFEIVLGKQPMTPLDVAKSKNQGKCPAAYRVATDRLEMLSEAQDRLRKA